MPHIALVGCTTGAGPRVLAAARRLGYQVTAVVPKGTAIPAADYVVEAANAAAVLAGLRAQHRQHPLDGVVGCGGVTEELASLAALALGLPGADATALARAGRRTPAARSGYTFVAPVVVDRGSASVVALGAAGEPEPVFPAPALLSWQRHRLARAAVNALAEAGLQHGVYWVRLVLTGQGPRVLGIDAGVGQPAVLDLVEEHTGVDLAEEAIRLAVGSAPVTAPAPAPVTLPKAA